ncbi:hypothetical protein [Brenneria sp. L3-3Z]|uniref:hypothetical protein n=1 Tax=unclassified Brenneria TaxID=2634434 RepID=UPI0039B43AC2
MYLRLNPGGSRLWYLKYRIDGKATRLPASQTGYRCAGIPRSSYRYTRKNSREPDADRAIKRSLVSEVWNTNDGSAWHQKYRHVGVSDAD